MDGDFVKEWKSISDVNSAFKRARHLSTALKLGHECCGFQWSLEKVEKLPKHSKNKQVGKYSLDGQLLQVFNTVMEAKKDTVGAPGVLSGQRKTAGGFIWKYIDN